MGEGGHSSVQKSMENAALPEGPFCAAGFIQHGASAA